MYDHNDYFKNKKPGLLNRASKKLSTRKLPLLVINLSYFRRLLVLSQFWWLWLRTCNGKVFAENWWFFSCCTFANLCLMGVQTGAAAQVWLALFIFIFLPILFRFLPRNSLPEICTLQLVSWECSCSYGGHGLYFQSWKKILSADFPLATAASPLYPPTHLRLTFSP